MNSLNDLNQSFDQVIFDDDRAPAIIFDRTIPENQTLNFNEGQNVALPNGINIVEIIDFETIGCTVTFDVRDIPGSTLTWTDLPEDVEPEILEPGVYRLPVTDAGAWNLIKNPTLIPDIDFFGVYSFTVTINYSSTLSKIYTISGEVSDVQEWNTESLDDIWFDPDNNPISLNAPLLSNNDLVPVRWFVTVSVNVPQAIVTFTSQGTGGTFSVNSTTKQVTINGTNAQINSHLSTLKMLTNTSVFEHFVLTYRAISLVDVSSDSLTQNFFNQKIRYLGQPRSSNINFSEDAAEFSIDSTTPLITHIESTGTGQYTLLVTANKVIRNLATTGVGGSSSFDFNNRILTLTGTRTQINNRLNTLSIKVEPDSEESFVLTYSVTTPDSFTASKTQTFTNIATHPEIQNINLVRSYFYNKDFVFKSQIPLITDTDTTFDSYEITFTSTQGVFSLEFPQGTIPGNLVYGNVSGTFTVSGNRSSINQYLFPFLKFERLSTSFQNGTIVYQQIKKASPDITQNITNIVFNGPGVNFDTLTPTNSSLNVDEGSTFALPVNLNATGIQNPLTLRITIPNAGQTTVQWPTVPAGCVVSNPSAGVFQISNITTLAQWNTVRSPNVILDNVINGQRTIDVDVLWNRTTELNVVVAEQLGWDLVLNINDIALLSQPQSGKTYSSGDVISNIGAANLVDPGTQTLTYTVIVSYLNGVTNISSTGSGGTVSFNSSARTFTITGTLSQVNSRLNGLVITSATNSPSDLQLTYSATSSAGETAQVVQTITKLQDFTGQALTGFFINVEEGQNHSVEIPASINFINSNYTGIALTINVSSIPGAIVVWPTIPAGHSVSNPSSGIYSMQGISNSTWNIVNRPLITLRNDVNGSYTYTSTVETFPIAAINPTLTSTTNLVIAPTELFTSITENFEYLTPPTGNGQSIPAPLVVDPGNQQPTYTVLISPNRNEAFNNYSSSGGGIASIDPFNRTYLITGTLSEINQRLATLKIFAVSGIELAYTLTYSCTNNLNSETDSVVLNLTASPGFTSPVRNNVNYTINTLTNVQGGPLIDTSENTLIDFELTANPSTAISSFGYVQQEQINSYFTAPTVNSIPPSVTKISANGDIAAVSYASESNTNVGFVRIYKKNASGIWSLQTTITAPGSMPGGGFGLTLDLNGDANALIVSEPYWPNLNEPQGRVHIYNRVDNTWSLTASVNSGDVTADQQLGRAAVVISDDGNTAVAVNNPQSQAATRIFRNINSQWVLEQTLNLAFWPNFDSEINHINLSSDGNTLMLITSTRLVNIYKRINSVWSLNQSIDIPNNSTFVGPNSADMTANADTIVIGQPAINNQRGAVHVYKLINNSYTLSQTLTASDAANLHNFGRSVAISRTGSKILSSRSNPSSTTYVFTLSNSTYVQETYRLPILNFSLSDNGENIVNREKFFYISLPVYNSITKKLTQRNYRSVINAQIDNLTLSPSLNYNLNFELDYRFILENAVNIIRNQFVIKV
jgi:hypothetical protein